MHFGKRLRPIDANPSAAGFWKKMFEEGIVLNFNEGGHMVNLEMTDEELVKIRERPDAGED